MSNTILEVQTRFNDWITFRINEYNFVENQDFVIFTEKSVKMQRGRPGKEYSLSIPMAKELAMIEKTDQGKMARLYFIECEKQLKKVSLTPKQECFLEIAEAANQQAVLLALNKLNNTVIIHIVERDDYVPPPMPEEEELITGE